MRRYGSCSKHTIDGDAPHSSMPLLAPSKLGLGINALITHGDLLPVRERLGMKAVPW